MCGGVPATQFVTRKDGHANEKIMCTAFQQPDDYLGIPEIDFGTRVEVVYERGKRGNIRLKSIQRTE